MTNAENPQRGHRLVNPEGSNSQRLNEFNSNRNNRGFGDKQVYTTVVQTNDWSPDNRYFYGDVSTNLVTSDSVILRVSLHCQGS